MRTILFLVTAWIWTVGTGLGQVDARMFRFPDVSEALIAFVYAGDIWIVDKTGGTAKKLSSPPGEEMFPRFSPDGSHIAFSGNYDGNTDVYVVATLGGEPFRVTYHPASDRLLDWSADGKELLFASRRASGVQRFSQLYVVSAEGGLPRRLPVPYGEFGAIAADGRTLAYTPKTRDFRTWKRYRGGMAPEIWLFDLETLNARNVSKSDANDAQPMWHGQTLYFLSDRGPSERSNIWALDIRSRAVRQITRFTDFDVTFPAIGPSNIVFQAGGRLYLMDLSSEDYREVHVRVVTDLARLKPRRVNVSKLIHAGHISPSGKRAVFEARGDVLTVPSEHGVIRNLTRTSDSAERYPAWSPDGKHIAYWSDRTGEYELTLSAADGSEEKSLTHLGEGYRYRLFWSPDSQKIAFIDHAQRIRVYDLDSGQIREVDRGLWMHHGVLQGFELSWSGDSRWLAYARGLETTNTAIFLFDTQNGETHQVTSGYYGDRQPVFDPEGDYLYYLSNRDLQPIYSDLDATWIYPNTTRIVVVGLRKDVDSPLAPRNDEEGSEPAARKPKEPGREEKADKGEQEEERPRRVAVDLEDFEQRGVILPPEAGNYNTLRAVSGKVLYHRMPRSGSSSKNRPVVFYDLEKREEKTILEDATGYEVSADGKKILARVKNDWAIVAVQPGQKVGGPKGTRPLATKNLEALVDPRREWRQIFNDVWRTYRDDFYDPGMHGLDWKGLRRHYGALLEDAVTRWDVNFVIGQLIGEVNASHTYVGGGDTEAARRKKVGLLGIDWALDEGAYKVARVVRGAAWDIATRSPLDEPGVDIQEGDYILAVNGIPLEPTKPPYASFEGLASQTVALTVNDRPTTEGAREILVETLDSEARLRNREWVEHNRQKVEKDSGGRVGYIFVPNTAVSGQTELVRQLNSQIRKEGLIIDERFNSGGQLPDRFIEKLNRQMVTRIAFRHGATLTHPTITHYGPKVMLINGWAGSGGDAFPFFFEQMKVGPLIGERTWGGLIGPAMGHDLIDGGRFTAPPGRIYSPEGVWFAEGHGVDPDIPVVDDPGTMARGGDPQLEAAVKQVLRLIEQHPPRFAEPPPFEKRTPRER